MANPDLSDDPLNGEELLFECGPDEDDNDEPVPEDLTLVQTETIARIQLNHFARLGVGLLATSSENLEAYFLNFNLVEFQRHFELLLDSGLLFESYIEEIGKVAVTELLFDLLGVAYGDLRPENHAAAMAQLDLLLAKVNSLVTENRQAKAMAGHLVKNLQSIRANLTPEVWTLLVS